MLTASEREAIDARIAAIEAATGVEVVTAVIGKADAYPELPWTAFAGGASLGALAMVAADALRPEWAATDATLLAAVTILGAGGACALAAVFVPAFARLFLRGARRDLEVRQYARSLFLERELFRTGERIGILLLVSLFERRVELLADTGFDGRIGAAEWARVVARMTPYLADGRPAAALLEGLAGVDELLARAGLRTGEGDINELPDPTHRVEGHMIRWLAPVALLVAGTLLAPLHAADVPYLSGRVVDHAEILSPATRDSLTAALQAHEEATTNQIAVLTVPTIDGESIEGYATRVFEAWKLGRKDRDNGVLVVIVPQDRKLRIEVGYGLEGTLTDVACSRIIRNLMTPRFKAGDYDRGTADGVLAVIAPARRASRGPPMRRRRQRWRRSVAAARRSRSTPRTCRGRCASCSAPSSSGSLACSPSSAS